MICGCLEPGKDGVGDYVMILLKELSLRGMKTFSLAVNDPFVLREKKDMGEIPSYRLPAIQNWRNKIDNARKWINEIAPDHIAWQFVIYAYHPRGLPFWPLYLLKNLLTKDKIVSVTFHELWIGEAKSDSYKSKVIGWFQKRLLKRMLMEICPVEVFTSNRFYQICLEKIGVRAKIVPILSNIPSGCHRNSLILNHLPANVLKNRKRYLVASFFGSVQFSKELDKKLSCLKILARKENKELIITHVGRSEGVKENIFKWRNELDLQVFSFGMQSKISIANYFRAIDIGLSTYPKVLFEKSGSIAAMKFNNLPVVLLRTSFLEDNREFNWIKEIDEITSLGHFISNARAAGSSFKVEPIIDSYVEAFGILHKK